MCVHSYTIGAAFLSFQLACVQPLTTLLFLLLFSRFAVFGPSTWNSLPAALRTSDHTLSSFKRDLKTHLFCCFVEQWTYTIDRRCCDINWRESGAVYECSDLLTYLLTVNLHQYQAATVLNYSLHSRSS